MMTEREEVEAYRKVLNDGLQNLCDAMGVSMDIYDRDKSDFSCYIDCFNDAKQVIKDSEIRYDEKTGGFHCR